MVLLGEEAQVKAQFGLFGDSANLDERQVYGLHEPNAPQAKKAFWMHPMVLLGKGVQVKSWFGLFGDSANLDARQVHSLHGTYHMLRNQFGRTRQNSLITCVVWNPASVRLETVFVLVQNMCTICAQCTIGSEIIVEVPDGTPM